MFCGSYDGLHQTTATTQISTIDGQASKILPNLPGLHRNEPATTEDGSRVYLAGGWYYDYLHPTPPDGNRMLSSVYMIDFNFENPTWKELSRSRLSNYGFHQGTLRITPGNKMMYIFGSAGFVPDSVNVEEYLHLVGRSSRVYETETRNSYTISYTTNTTLSIIGGDQRNYHSTNSKPTIVDSSELVGQFNIDDYNGQQYTNFVI